MRFPSEHLKRKLASGSSRSVNLAQKYVKLDCGLDFQAVAKNITESDQFAYLSFQSQRVSEMLVFPTKTR